MDRKTYEFISKQTNDPIVERKTCAISGKEFAIFQSDLEFYDKISPIFTSPLVGGTKGGKKKYQIPTPTLSPEERNKRRLLRRNERKLYKRKCDKTNKSIISIYSEDKPYIVYDEKIRWGDSWNPLDYGFEFDFDKSFFEQFNLLMETTPQANWMNFNNEKSDYVNYVNDSNNCYLDFGSGFLENSCYCNWSYHGDNIFDSGYSFRGENSYMCVKCENFYHCMYCQESKDITDCSYCFDCENCSFCIGCVGLRGKQYYIFNKQYTKQEYLSKLEKVDIFAQKDKFLLKLGELRKLHTHRSMNISNSEKSFGNDIKNSKNSIICYESDNLQDCKYCTEVMNQKDIMDVNNNGWSQLEYEIMGFGYNNKVAFTLYSAECSNVFYSAYCQYSKNLFGCVGLKHKEYCIFNKQYTQPEYEQLVPQIISHMQKTGERGEFFPKEISPFGYNETVAQEYFPLTKQEAIDKGYKRMDQEYPVNIPDGIKIVDEEEILVLSDDEILNIAIKCKTSNKLFRIMKIELEFYRKNNIPLPLEHPDIRHQNRMKQRPHRDMSLRKCDHCQKEILSIWPNESQFKVYCETCYSKEIYG